MGKIETKVIAAFAGSGIAAATGKLILWLLAVFVWHQPNTAKAAADAVSAVPDPVATWLLIALAGLGALAGGYWAPHTFRSDLKDTAADAATDVQNVYEAAPLEATPPVATPAEPEAPAAGVPPPVAAPVSSPDLMLHDVG